MQYNIHPIAVGTKVFDKSMMTYQHNQGKEFVIPLYVWYLESLEEGGKTILVDTGEMHPIISEERQKALGGRIWTFEEGLAHFGLKPEDVDVILHTHLHNDHCENDYKCVNAKIYVHEKELENIHNPHPLDYRYLADFVEDVEEAGQIVPLTGDTEILPGITMLHTPAHTEGGMSVLVDTPGGKVLICGFCTIDENLNPPPAIRGMEMEVIPPGTHLNVKDAYDILLRARGLADRVLPLHEPRFAAMETIG